MRCTTIAMFERLLWLPFRPAQASGKISEGAVYFAIDHVCFHSHKYGICFIHAGDVLLGVDGTRVYEFADVIDMLKKSNSVVQLLFQKKKQGVEEEEVHTLQLCKTHLFPPLDSLLCSAEQ